MPGRIHRAHAEDNIVPGDGNGDRMKLASILSFCGSIAEFHAGSKVLPVGSSGLAPNDLVSGSRRRAGGRSPGQGGVAIVNSDRHKHILRCTRRGGEGGKRGRVEASNVGSVGRVDEVDEIPVLHSIFDAYVLMLMIKIFSPFGQADGSKAFLIEGSVVATTQKAVLAKLKHGGEGRGRKTGTGYGSHSTRQLPGRRVVFAGYGTDPPQFVGRGCLWSFLGENAHQVLIRKLVSRCGVPADNVVVQYALQIPALAAGEAGQMAASIEALFFAGNGHEDQGRGKLHSAEDPRAGQADGHAAGIVIGARRRIAGVLVGRVARVVMSGYKIHARALRWILSPQDGVYVSNERRL